MSDEFVFEAISTSDDSLVDVIFVHGLTGDAYETWSSPKQDDSFWPKWLKADLPQLSIYTLGYPASMFEKWAKKEMDIFERATNVLEHFAAKGIGTKPIVFVAHSLGGILTKILIRKSNDSEDCDYKLVSEATRLVIFLATPHTGSVLANILSILPNTSKNIALLANDIGFLEDLNGHYRKYANGNNQLSTKVYYEKHRTKKIVTVVSRESADPGIAETEPVPVDKDHINICKPSDKDDIVYLGVKRHIQKLLEEVSSHLPGAGGIFLGADYTNKYDGDRRDLLQKLIDAEREHEYEFANNAQNAFARDYAKTGLLSAARSDHDQLMSEVQTRFVTHVFHPLICKKAADEDIRKALQTYVVDPVTSLTIGETKFSSKAVLNALYFLTEQCHIRWDPIK